MISDEQAKKILARQVRHFRGDMSYSELARRMTTPEWTCYSATIQQIEAERHLASAGLLARLAEVFECSLDELLPISKRPKNTTPARQRLYKAS